MKTKLRFMKIKPILAVSLLIILNGHLLTAQENSPDNVINTDSAIYYVPENKTVNIPFGQSENILLPGFITTIDPADFILYDNISSVNDALNGRVPGFISGMNLHGLGPSLIIIDGMPGTINSINIEEIEQITVLRDVNSALLYGVQAGKGIVMITTKRGKIGKPMTEIIVDKGFSKPVSLPHYLNAADYMELYNEALSNDGLSPSFLQSDIDATRKGTNQYRYPDKDYYTSEFIKNAKPFSRYLINFSGGNLNTQYFLQAGWTNSGSLLQLGEKERANNLNIRSNVNFKVNDFIKASIDIAGTFNIYKGPNGNFWNDAATFYPNIYTTLIDTAIISNKEIFNGAEFIKGKYLLGGTNQYQKNIYGNLYLSGYHRDYATSLLYKTGIEIDLKTILKGLKFKTYASFGNIAQFTEAQNNTYAVFQPSWAYMGDNQYEAYVEKIGLDRFTGTQALNNMAKSRSIGFYALLDYNRAFKNEQHIISGSVIAFTNATNTTGTLYENKYNHIGTRLAYVYKRKYIIDFSSATSLSLQLAPESRIALSPSAGLGWILSEESFLKNNQRINLLKLKASAGWANTDINITDFYLYRSAYITQSIFTWNDGGRQNDRVIISNIENPMLGYEKRYSYNIGAEALLFNNALFIDINAFKEKAADKITQKNATTPEFLGGILPYENYGIDKYAGIDMNIVYRNKINKVNYDIGGSFTYLTSKVVQADEMWEYDYLYRTGKRTDAIFGLRAIGLFPDINDIENHQEQTFGMVKPGDIKYMDQNDDGIIDQNDIVMLGNSMPDLALSLHIKLNYGNLSFFAMATGNYGAERYFTNSYYWVYGDRKYSEIVKNRWTEQTAETATYPRLSSGLSSNNFRNSSFWLFDNSRINVDRIQITYDIKSMIPKINAKNIDIYFRASNVGMIAKNKDKLQLNHNSEPQYRHYSIGFRTIF